MALGRSPYRPWGLLRSHLPTPPSPSDWDRASMWGESLTPEALMFDIHPMRKLYTEQKYALFAPIRQQWRWGTNCPIFGAAQSRIRTIRAYAPLSFPNLPSFIPLCMGDICLPSQVSDVFTLDKPQAQLPGVIKLFGPSCNDVYLPTLI